MNVVYNFIGDIYCSILVFIYYSVIAIIIDKVFKFFSNISYNIIKKWQLCEFAVVSFLRNAISGKLWNYIITIYVQW